MASRIWIGRPTPLAGVAATVGRIARPRSRWIALVALVLAAGAVVLVVSPVGEFPVDDDWIYAEAVRRLLRDGAYQPSVWIDTSFVAQAWWGAAAAKLLGFSYTTLRLSTLALAAAGGAFFFALARRAVPSNLALPMVCLLLLHPLVFHLAYSFMTDIPFLTMMLAALWCTAVGIEHAGERRLGWLAAGSLCAGTAFLVRQIGVVIVPVALAAALPELGDGRRPRAAAIAAMVLPFAAVAGLGTALVSGGAPADARTLSLLAPSHLAAVGQSAANASPSALMLLGLSVSPFAIPALTRRATQRPTRETLVATGLMLLLVVAIAARTESSLSPLFGNTLYAAGLTTSGLHPTAIAVGPVALAGLVALSILGAIALALAVGRVVGARVPVSIRLLALSSLGMLLVTIGYAGGVRLYDRYLIPSLPGALAVAAFAARDRRIAVPIAWIGVIGFAVWSVPWQQEYMARQAAVWTVANEMAARGIDPAQIEAGYEWDGVHRGDEAIARASVQPASASDPDAFVQAVIDELFRRTAWSVDFRLPPGQCPGQLVETATYGAGWPVYGLRACSRSQNLQRRADGPAGRPQGSRRARFGRPDDPSSTSGGGAAAGSSDSGR